MPSAVFSAVAARPTARAKPSISGQGCTFSSLTSSCSPAFAPFSASAGVSRAV
jgi:hypothetical protein